MVQVTHAMLSERLHQYSQEHTDVADAQLDFLGTLHSPLMGDVVIGFINRVAGDTLTRLRRDTPTSPLIPRYEALLIIEE